MNPSHEKEIPPQEVETLNENNPKGAAVATGDLDVGASLVQNHDTNFSEDGKQS